MSSVSLVVNDREGGPDELVSPARACLPRRSCSLTNYGSGRGAPSDRDYERWFGSGQTRTKAAVRRRGPAGTERRIIAGAGSQRTQRESRWSFPGTFADRSNGSLPTVSQSGSLSRGFSRTRLRCRLGARRFGERFDRDALVTHLENLQLLCAARRLQHHRVSRPRLHQRARQW